jgi:hypothetical protein
LLRIDGRHAGVMPLEMEIRWGDDAVQILERREGGGPGGTERHTNRLLERRSSPDVPARRALHLGGVLCLGAGGERGAHDPGGSCQHATAIDARALHDSLLGPGGRNRRAKRRQPITNRGRRR